MRKMKLIYFAIAMLICICSNAQRKKLNLDENWKFEFGDASNPEKDFNYGIKNIFSKSGGALGTAIDPVFNDSTWRTLNLPHDWAVELPFVNNKNLDVESHGFKPVGGLFPSTSIGWYRKKFKLEKSDSGRRYQLQFDGIFRDANIWINGFYLGNNKSGYLGVNYDVTDFLNFESNNVIVVRADASQYEGWFYEGAGIYRHVWLNSYPSSHIDTDGVFAYAKINGSKAILNVETSVINEYGSSTNYSISTYLNDRYGNKISEAKEYPILLNVLEQKTLKQSIAVNNPILWSLDTPYLYRIVVELKQNGKIIDQYKLRFGFRNIEINSKGVFLNGKHLKIYGANNHQNHAGVGTALPDYLQYYRVGLLKEMGVNAYRTSHNAPTPELLDACDSLGMLVMDEHRLLNSGAEYMSQFERLLKRDRSRTSVFMWSIGNEEGWIHTNSFGKRIAETFIAKQKKLDPTRTCTYAADLANVYNGINEVIPVRGFNYRQFAVADYHKDHPYQPIIGTEMGSTVTTRGVLEKDSILAYVPDQDITAPWWASQAEEWWKLAAPNDYWLGGFIWTGFDYRGEPTPFKWPNINSHFGVMDVCGFPKNIYYYYQSWWTDKDVLHISPHWNHVKEWGQQKKVIDVWVNSNADNVELFLNGNSLGKKDMPLYGHLKWEVEFEPGTLEAIAYKKGRLLKSKVQTTGVPYEVILTPYKTTLLADGKDITIINVSTIDKEGREVPNADNIIRFKLKGDAKIIGVGNGDPSSHESDKCKDGLWQRSLFNGKCQIIIQSGSKEGSFKIEASAANLIPGSTDVIMVAPDELNKIVIDDKYVLKNKISKPIIIDKMLGADISFLPELEDKGVKFTDKNISNDALNILRQHGFNYIRLRVFNNPSSSDGYSPDKGFCNLDFTKKMAKRIKAAGLKLLLDFHYSDNWADPGKQYKPEAWRNLAFEDLKLSLFEYTKGVIKELQAQGTTPDMVQIGNEINHGILWPDGDIRNINNLAQLVSAGIFAVKSVDPNIKIMLHVALGGQNNESEFFIDNMLSRGVQFDVIGQSYYPKWHGTLNDLENNLNSLVKKYDKDIIVVEYSELKEEVNKIVFGLPNGKGKGTFIWEPLNTWEKFFDENGNSNKLLNLYDSFNTKYLKN